MTIKECDEMLQKELDFFNYISVRSRENIVLDGDFSLADLKRIVAILERLEK